MPAPEDVTSTGAMTVLVVGAGSHNVSAELLTVSSTIESLNATLGQIYASLMTVSSSTPSMDAFLMALPTVMRTADVVYPRTAVYPMHAADVLVVDSVLHPGLRLFSQDGGIITETASFLFGPWMRSTAAGTDRAYPKTVVQSALYSDPLLVAIELSDAEAYFVTASAITVSASTYRRSTVRQALTSSGVVSRTLTLTLVRAADLLADLLTAAGSLHPQIDAAAVAVAQTGFVEAVMAPKTIGLGATALTATGAWTANTDNWAMTRYAPYEFSSVASWGGKLYAAGPTGLVELSGATDSGGEVAARVDSHLTDFKDNRLKLPRGFYLGYQSEQPLTVTMSSTDAGEEREYEYTAPPRTAETFVPDRVKLGRGLRSRYFRFSILNVSGGYFSIDTAFVDADISDRRL